MERLGLTRRYAVLERVRCVGCGDRWSPDEQANAGFEAVVAEYRRMAGEGEADGDGKPAAPDNTRRVKAGAGAAADGGKGPRAANSNRRDGTRTAARLEERMRRRATRMALDVVRHQELLDAQALREARALSRRWFILGRGGGAPPRWSRGRRRSTRTSRRRPSSWTRPRCPSRRRGGMRRAGR